MRYIDAENIEYTSMCRARGNGMYEDCEIAHKDQIDDIPTADVVEVEKVNKIYEKLADVFNKLLDAIPTAGEDDCDNCEYDYCPQCADETRKAAMTDREILDALLQVIGSYTYGKERWFREYETTVWYDRATGTYIDAESMINNVMSAIKAVSYD